MSISKDRTDVRVVVVSGVWVRLQQSEVNTHELNSPNPFAIWKRVHHTSSKL